MFNEIKAEVLRSKAQAAYEASQRALMELQNYLQECPHNSVTLCAYQAVPIVNLAYRCDCCGKTIYKLESGEWYCGGFIKPEVKHVND